MIKKFFKKYRKFLTVTIIVLCSALLYLFSYIVFVVACNTSAEVKNGKRQMPPICSWQPILKFYAPALRMIISPDDVFRHD